MPNKEQKEILLALARVIRKTIGNADDLRSGLRDAYGSFRSMTGRGSAKEIEKSGRIRKYWGWGYEEEGPDALMVELLLEVLKIRFGLEGFPEIVPPNIKSIQLRNPRFDLPNDLADFCVGEKSDRISHSYGKAFRDLVRSIRGRYENPIDYVAYPENEDQIQRLIGFCGENRIALTPYGGGSSVVGGVEPTRSEAYRGTVSLDMKNFNRVLEVDETSRAARVQAGIYGPALEAALKPYGLSPRFYPQSFEFSTLGGWIATRAGGHFCTLYTHIDDIVESVRVVTPAGIHETRRLPASGAGPSQERFWLGSEGIFGVITEAWIRLHARPQHRSSATVRFKSFLEGAQAVRALSQSKLYPVNCRLVSRLEALSMGLGDGKHAILLLGFESESYPQRDAMNKALQVCRQFGGSFSRRKVRHTQSTVRDGSAGSWRNNFLKAPYLRDIMATRGLVTETFETAITWDRFERFHQGILKAAQRAFDEHCRGRGMITCRFTHIYPDGPAPYYSVVAWSEPERQLETWDAIKASVSEAVIELGGTITHHHAVGRDHRPWYEKERQPLFEKNLMALKSTMDPRWTLNPGVLLKERKS